MYTYKNEKQKTLISGSNLGYQWFVVIGAKPLLPPLAPNSGTMEVTLVN